MASKTLTEYAIGAESLPVTRRQLADTIATAITTWALLFPNASLGSEVREVFKERHQAQQRG